MGVVNRKSTAITNATATPRVLNSANLQNANLRGAQGLANLGAADSNTSTHRLFRVRSSDLVWQLVVYCLDIGTTATGDVGIYKTNDAGGAVVDVDLFASALAISGGALSGVDITFEAAANNGVPANGEKRIWEAIGLTADPMIEYDVVFTQTADTDAAGVVLFRAVIASGE
jgi:hypothetical protein